MTRKASLAVAGPSYAVKWIVSLLLAAHFFAIAMAVTQSSNPRYPTPPVAEAMSREPIRAYQQLTFLGNAYRFYAPDPGPVPILWYRLEFEDGSIWWFEWPDRDAFWLRMPYQRNLSVTMLIAQNEMLYQPGMGRVIPAGLATGPLTGALLAEGVTRQPATILGPMSQIGIRSYVRYLARRIPTHPVTGARLARVIPFKIEHGLLSPDNIRQGWKPTDMRLYGASEIGIFHPDGSDANVLNYILRPVPPLRFAGDILLNDYYRMLHGEPHADRTALMNRMNMPRPLRELLERFPELKELSAVGLELKEIDDIYRLMKSQGELIAPLLVQAQFWTRLEQMVAAADRPLPLPPQAGPGPLPMPVPRPTSPPLSPRQP